MLAVSQPLVRPPMADGSKMMAQAKRDTLVIPVRAWGMRLTISPL